MHFHRFYKSVQLRSPCTSFLASKSVDMKWDEPLNAPRNYMRVSMMVQYFNFNILSPISPMQVYHRQITGKILPSSKVQGLSCDDPRETGNTELKPKAQCRPPEYRSLLIGQWPLSNYSACHPCMSFMVLAAQTSRFQQSLAACPSTLSFGFMVLYQSINSDPKLRRIEFSIVAANSR